LKRGCLYRIGHFIMYGLLGLVILIMVASGISAMINQSLPTRSRVVDYLDDLQKSRLAEFYHLQQTLGEKVWPGWGEVEIPIIVYNEEYAFLIGYSDPPSGWIKMPQKEARGGPWEPVSDDLLDGQTYYRQRLMDPNRSPEGFTVLVGDRWVTTFQTMEYSEISFYIDLRDELPPLVREIAPYKLIYKLLVGDSDVYITILAHESFHSYQAMVNLDTFSQAEEVMRLEGKYPWEEPIQQKYWQAELNLLALAAKEDDIIQAKELARQFLARREERRSKTELNRELIDFERQREWLEGLAKYAELSIGRIAAITLDYEWLPGMDLDPRFNNYLSRERFWTLQLDQVRNILNNAGEIRFYYSGFAQAVLLDKLLPEWKDKTFSEGIALEDSIRSAISQP
jgi:hypothetical protein